MSKGETEREITAFKRAQVRHRRQGTNPHRADDLDELLDFSNPDQHMIRVKCPRTQRDECYQGPLYTLPDYPGFVYAPQALAPCLQEELAFRAVSEYCEAPHATNIDLVPPKAGIEENNMDESMWKLWKQQQGFDSIQASTTRKKYRSFDKLAWSTMGYHYDWTARTYREESKSPMPVMLQQLGSLFARTCLQITSNQRSTNFTASACIVNYYHVKSIMGGHRDDLELALDKPVISLSMGLPAIFLLGGTTKHDPLVAILVRPGDIMMLGGASRLCFHGMARVLPAAVTLAPVNQEESSFQVTRESLDCNELGPVPDSDRAALTEYLRNHRININVRQVLPDDMTVLPQVPADGDS